MGSIVDVEVVEEGGVAGLGVVQLGHQLLALRPWWCRVAVVDVDAVDVRSAYSWTGRRHPKSLVVEVEVAIDVVAILDV